MYSSVVRRFSTFPTPRLPSPGTRIPSDLFLYTRYSRVSCGSLFSSKKCIVFGLPGAFTPTCSSSHLPRYEEVFSNFKRIGIDSIYCVAVNDAHVMEAWAQAHQIQHVEMLPDGNGDFTRHLGMLVDLSEAGMGWRSWRYSMIVNDGIIEKGFVEEKDMSTTDPFKVSDAETMYQYLAPDQKLPMNITLFVKEGCGVCHEIESQLEQIENSILTKLRIGRDITRSAVEAIAGSRNLTTLPVVFIDGKQYDVNQLEALKQGQFECSSTECLL